ncbi:glycosyltransferase family 9 protein [Brevibacterium renqingii]|uniref:glycosyltransferase family 9 protein n=1 Tax=Brevibacterium renqingii TaxID=2776916 RepID=UPI001AE0E0A7|nr:glycosyltransferase family 9 protein [Brevibacterium renqingii]
MARDVVLALRALGIGDLLVAVPALRGLRTAFPDSELVLACPEYLRPLIAAIGCVDEILPVGPEDIGAPPEQRKEVFDAPVGCVVNLHGRGPSSHIWLESFDAALRWGHAAPGWCGPEWIEDVHERRRWTQMLAHFGAEADAEDLRIDPAALPVALPSPAAVVHVGASQVSRLWPIERFVDVGVELLRRGHDVVLTGSGAERPRAQQAAELIAEARPLRSDGSRLRVAAGAQTFGEFCASIAAADVVVSADTGAAHLANAFSRPSAVIFGPARVLNWGPPEGPHVVLTHEELRRGDPFASSPDPALLAVTAREAIDALDALGL